MKIKKKIMSAIFIVCSMLPIFTPVANAYAPSAFGWTLGEMIYGYPQWPHYYRWRVAELGVSPFATRYNAFLSIGPYERYEIQVTKYGRVSVISGISEFGSLKACLAAELALSPGLVTLTKTTRVGFNAGAYDVSSDCTPQGSLAYQVAFIVSA